MRSSLLVPSAILGLVSLASSARADTLQGVFQSGITISGDIKLGSDYRMPGVYTIAALDVTTQSAAGTNHFTIGPFSQGEQLGPNLVFVTAYADDSNLTYGDSITLALPISSFLSGAGPVCSLALSCYFGEALFPSGYAVNNGPFEILEQGSISAGGTITPEPSTLILLGTGLLGAANLGRWRR